MIFEERITLKLFLIYFIISVSVLQSGVDFQMSLFLYYTPKHQCLPPNPITDSITPDNCFYMSTNSSLAKRPCTKWIFDKSKIRSTFVTEMNLVCDKRFLQWILIPLRNISGVFAILLGILSDMKGRKLMFLICSGLDTIIWILLGILPTSYPLHVFLRFIKLFGIGSSIIGFVLATEVTPKKYRNFIVINYWSLFSIGMAVTPWYIKNFAYWKESWLLAAWPMLIYSIAPFILLESPIWLKANNQKDKAFEVLQILNQNSEDIDLNDKSINETEIVRDSKEFCHSKSLIIRLSVLLLTSLSFYFVYQGTATNLEFAISDIYINAMIMGLIEIPAGPLGYLSNKVIGSVTSVVLWTSISIISYAMIPDNWEPMLILTETGKISHTILACFSKFSLVVAWNILMVFYVGLFPTNKRNFVANFGEVSGFIGAAIGGFVGYYYSNYNNGFTIANFIYGILLIISIALFGLIIPSINKTDLPNTVEEAELIKKDPQCCFSEHTDDKIIEKD